MSERLKYCDLCGISEVEGILSGKSTELIPITVIIEDEVGSVEACPSCAAEFQIAAPTDGEEEAR